MYLCTCFCVPPSVADLTECSQNGVTVFVSVKVELDPGLITVVNYCYLRQDNETV